MNGADVERWQTFLVGQGVYHNEVDGDFGPATYQASVDFQRAVQVTPDGVVGDKTFGAAMLRGFSLVPDSDVSDTGPNWPPAPPGVTPLVSNSQREALFGKFTYVPAPTAWNREAIKVTNTWAQDNIVMVDVPQLARLKFPKVAFHKTVAHQLQGFFADVEKEGLLDLVLTWDGSYAPRFVRGSTQYLSNHAWGTAFDINAQWNPLGTKAPLVGQKGSVRKLVPIALQWGFYWGGFFGRVDAMHFEAFKLI